MIYSTQFDLNPMIVAHYPTKSDLIRYAWRLVIQQLERQRVTANSITFQALEIMSHDYMPNQEICRVAFDVIPYTSPELAKIAALVKGLNDP